MGFGDIVKRVVKSVFPARVQEQPKPHPNPPPSETATQTITMIRGIKFDESLFTATSSTLSAHSDLPVVVLAFLDGRRVRGHIFNFAPSRDVCKFFPSTGKGDAPGEQIELKKLKAIFFFREKNNAATADAELLTAPLPHPGRKLVVVFADNERLPGTTTGYTPDRQGFFLIPNDPTGKIQRVYVINANAKQVNWV